MTEIRRFLVALGANLPSLAGEPAETLQLALTRLDQAGLVIRAVSRFYRTPAFPPGSGPNFVNAAAELEAPITPRQLLDLLHETEAAMHRTRTARWAARTLDLDLIASGRDVLPDAETQSAWRNLSLERQKSAAPADLILPHPRMQDRAFVLVPLADIAPDWRHPVLGATVREMLLALPEAARREPVPI